MKIIRFFFLLCLLFSSGTAGLWSQNTVNIWHFGDSCGIDFNSGAPVTLLNGAMDTEEGCATICNAAGQLRFYTNGLNVWNRNHQIMPNGLGLHGDISSTQSGIIVPRPGNNNQYFIFTVDDLGGANGLKYSEVDMTLQSGLGDVTVKNIPLVTPVAEKVTAVNHANNIDFWVITHGWNNNTFYAYLVTATGVSGTPVTTSIGQVHGGNNLNSLGYLKASHDGARLATAIYTQGIFEIFDFNNATGVVTNPVTCASPNYINAYGIEFSPDNNLLYTTVDAGGNANIFQFNLLAGGPGAIAASAVSVGGTGSGGRPGAIQLAPDNRLYIARNNSFFLGTIDNPDVPGTGCGYTNNGYHLGGRISWYGLPNFIQSIFILPEIEMSDSCFGDYTSFSLSSNDNIDSLIWNFDDPASGAANTSTLFATTHQYSDSGWFYPTVLVWHSGISDTIFDSVHIVMAPRFDLGADRQLCPGDSVFLEACWPGAATLWENGSTLCSRAIGEPGGIFWASVSNRCGTPRDTIRINYYPPTVLNAGPDTTLCQGESILLDAGSGHRFIQWNTGESTQTITAAEDLVYILYVLDANGCPATDETSVHLKECHQYLFMPNAFTPNGDGLNELFAPVPGGEKISIRQFYVLNRWGGLVFQSEGAGWDGMYKNQSCPEGVYTWRVHFTDEKGIEVQRSGTVMLVR